MIELGWCRQESVKSDNKGEVVDQLTPEEYPLIDEWISIEESLNKMYELLKHNCTRANRIMEAKNLACKMWTDIKTFAKNISSIKVPYVKDCLAKKLSVISIYKQANTLNLLIICSVYFANSQTQDGYK